MKICNVILTAWALALATVAGQTVEKPNVIFLMADDLGFGDIGFNGNKLVKTPNLDQMAADGLRFTRFYSVGPVCSPTRACVQTGRHCMRFGMITVNVGKLPKREINLARIAKSKGYDTGHFGKWHLGTMTKDPELSGPAPASTDARYGPPWERHYDETFTTETNVATWDPLDESDLRIPKHRCHFWSNGKEIKEDWKGSSEKIIMGRAIDFMEKSVESGKPFMATVWFYGPHSPTRAGRELRELYPNQPLGRQHYLGSITSIDQEIGNGDIRAFVSRDDGTTWTQLTLASQGSTGAHTILSAHDLDISGQPSGTDMRYKLTTHNQSVTKQTRIHAVSLGWSQE